MWRVRTHCALTLPTCLDSSGKGTLLVAQINSYGPETERRIKIGWNIFKALINLLPLVYLPFLLSSLSELSKWSSSIPFVYHPVVAVAQLFQTASQSIHLFVRVHSIKSLSSDLSF